MTLDQVLLTSAGIVWRQRILWMLGLLATVGGLLFSLTARVLFLGRPSIDLGLNQYDPAATILESLSPAPLIAGVLAIFLALITLWLLNVVAEGALIVAVKGSQGGQPVTLAAAVRAGLGLAGRFIGIDTLLFLPLLVLTLALMMVGFVGLAALVLAATRPGAQMGDLLLIVGLWAAISVPIMLLMLVTALVTLLLRTLAFRAGALEDLTSSQSIKRSAIVLRRKALSVTMIVLILWALRSLLGMPLRFVGLALVAIQLGQYISAATDPAQTPLALETLLAVAGLLVAILSGLLAAIMNAYGSTSWTLAYGHWTNELA